VRDHITREASEAGDDESAIAAVGELRTLLTASPKR
jgi:hypothetical protein